jgi:hypothetical protein
MTVYCRPSSAEFNHINGTAYPHTGLAPVKVHPAGELGGRLCGMSPVFPGCQLFQGD